MSGRCDALKAAVRTRMLARRRGQAPERVARSSLLVARRLEEMPEYRLARVVCCYLASHGEVVLDGVIADAWRLRKLVAVPAWRARAKCYGWRVLQPGQVCPVGRFGIREPERGHWLDGAEAGLVCVPGVAFDRYGNRVGHGAGFYDRLLRAMPDVCRVGVCFTFQVFSRLPAVTWDEPMDALATENGLVRVQR